MKFLLHQVSPNHGEISGWNSHFFPITSDESPAFSRVNCIFQFLLGRLPMNFTAYTPVTSEIYILHHFSGWLLVISQWPAEPQLLASCSQILICPQTFVQNHQNSRRHRQSPDSPPPDIQEILATTGWLEDCWCSFPHVPGILGASESWISFDLCRHRNPPDHRNHASRQDSA